MAVFHFTGLDHSQQNVDGEIAADSPRQAREVLRSRGYLITGLREENHTTNRVLLRKLFSKRTSKSESIEIIRDLSTLLAVGIPLTDAFNALLEQCPPHSRTVLLQVRDRINEGASFADAAKFHHELFDDLSVKMIEVGEKSGQLEDVLGQLADFKEKSLHWKDQVVSALIYPAIVLVASIGVTIFLMSSIVPTLLDNLVSAGHPLPWPTFILKSLSDFMIKYGLIVTFLLSTFALIIAVGLRSASGKRLFDSFMLRMPVFGNMVKKQAVARIALVISVLMRSGIEFVPACRIASDSIKNIHLQNSLLRSGEAVERGAEIGIALKSTNIFPPVVIQVFSVGQQTGQLEGMLERLSHDYEKQVATLSNKLATLLEPILIIFLSVIVGFILFATVLPILEAGNVLSS